MKPDDYINKLRNERDAARRAWAETARKLERVTAERDMLRAKLSAVVTVAED